MLAWNNQWSSREIYRVATAALSLHIAGRFSSPGEAILARKAASAAQRAAADRQRLADAQRAWIARIGSERGLTPTQIARKSGLHASTLTELINDSTRGPLSASSVQKIASGVHFPATAEARGGAPSAVPVEAEPFIASGINPRLEAAVSALIASRDGLTAWRLASGGLEGVGYKPGDILIVDRGEMPMSGDAVCAQYAQQDRTDIICRMVRRPWLVTGSNDPLFRPPLLIEDVHVNVIGTVVHSIRSR
jgi:transcriptional regulator with XRE-family HTH domain